MNLTELSGNSPQIYARTLLVRLQKSLRIFCFFKKRCDWIMFF